MDKLFKEFGPFNYVVNLACETRYGFDAPHYKINIQDIVENLATCCLAYKCTRLVEVSTAYVYGSSTSKKNETHKPSPERVWDQYKWKGEQALQQLSAKKGLQYFVLRPTKIYGRYDYQGMGQRFIATAVYSSLKQVQQQLWSEDQEMSTVHVRDVAKAIVYFLKMGSNGLVVNLADLTHTKKKHINQMLQNIFKCEIQCKNNFLSHIAWLKINEMLRDANEMHIEQWTKLCVDYQIEHTPLDILLYKENIDNYDLNIDGRMVSERFGFIYDYPQLKQAYIEEILQDFIARKLFPNILQPSAKMKELPNDAKPLLQS